jgi:hypothetical protein
LKFFPVFPLHVGYNLKSSPGPASLSGLFIPSFPALTHCVPSFWVSMPWMPPSLSCLQVFAFAFPAVQDVLLPVIHLSKSYSSSRPTIDSRKML